MNKKKGKGWKSWNHHVNKHPKETHQEWCFAAMEAQEKERGIKMKQKEWDGKTPLYSLTTKKYFHTLNELIVYTNKLCRIKFNLQLVICEPVKLKYVNTNYWKDDLPEDGKLPDEVHKALEKLNQTIEDFGNVAWKPTEYLAK